MMSLTVFFMQQHLSLINRHVNTVKDVPAREFIKAFAAHLKQNNKFKIPAVSDRPVSAFEQRVHPDVRVAFVVCLTPI